jgi:hypothetical protein
MYLSVQFSDFFNNLCFKIVQALSRRISQRPSLHEVQDRGIVPTKSSQEQKDDREAIRRELTRRLSQRPSVSLLKKKKIIKFEEYVDVYEVQYVDRKAEKPWTKLTATDKAMIRKELNEYKVIKICGGIFYIGKAKHFFFEKYQISFGKKMTLNTSFGFARYNILILK